MLQLPMLQLPMLQLPMLQLPMLQRLQPPLPQLHVLQPQLQPQLQPVLPPLPEPGAAQRSPLTPRRAQQQL